MLRAEQVRFARRRFGHFEVLDFVAILFGYAISGERTLEATYLAAAALGERQRACFSSVIA